MRGRPGARRNYQGDQSFIEGSDRWKRWPSFFYRLNLAGRRWTRVSGEYEGDTDTTGSAIRCNTQQSEEEKTA
jgi:hypothetical protein